MALFRDPKEHAENPPSTWEVERRGASNWLIVTKDGAILESGIKTKAKAEDLLVVGFLVNLYAKETRWYAGEKVEPWRMYSPPLKK